jgi:DNA-binding transcriptional MerR regulator
MPTRRTYQVKEVADLTGLTVRALHHYDSIGLLVPTARSAAGYRLYDDEDLLRLQQILIGRELGLPLEAIRRSLDDPQFDRRAALRAQRAELAVRAERAADMIRAIDAALTAIEEKDMSTVDFKKIFDGFDPKQHEAEAKQRWGDTDAYKVSMQRTKGYTAADWQRDLRRRGRGAQRRRAARRGARDGHRGAASPVVRPLVLSVQPRDAPRARRYVGSRSALCGEHRQGRRGRGPHGVSRGGRPRQCRALARLSSLDARRAERSILPRCFDSARRPPPHSGGGLFICLAACAVQIPRQDDAIDR